MSTSSSSSPWVRNSAVFDHEVAVSDNVIRCVYIMVAIAGFILIQSTYINWKKSYHNVRLCAELSSLCSLLAAISFIVNSNKPYNKVKSVVLYDLLYNGIFNLIVQLCDNYLFFMSLNAVMKIPPWVKKFIHLYIWFVLAFCWFCNYTVSPFFVDVNTDEYIKTSGWVIIFCSGWGTVLYNTCFSFHFAMYVWKTNKLAAWALRVDTVHRKRIISLKCMGHFFTSCSASLLYAYYPIDIGLPVYYIVISGGIHFWFNFKMENYLCYPLRKPAEREDDANRDDDSLRLSRAAAGSSAKSRRRGGAGGGGGLMPAIDENREVLSLVPSGGAVPHSRRSRAVGRVASIFSMHFNNSKDSSNVQPLPVGDAGRIDDEDDRANKVSLVLAAKDAEGRLEDDGFMSAPEPSVVPDAGHGNNGPRPRGSDPTPNEMAELMLRRMISPGTSSKVGVGVAPLPLSDGHDPLSVHSQAVGGVGGAGGVVGEDERRKSGGGSSSEQVLVVTSNLLVSGGNSATLTPRRVEMDRELAQLPTQLPGNSSNNSINNLVLHNSNSGHTQQQQQQQHPATFRKIYSLSNIENVRVEDLLRGSTATGTVIGGNELLRAAAQQSMAAGNVRTVEDMLALTSNAAAAEASSLKQQQQQQQQQQPRFLLRRSATQK